MARKSLCRLCLSSSEIFENLHGNLDLLGKISLLAQIEIKIDNKLPHSICENCNNNINNFYNFRCLILDTNEKLINCTNVEQNDRKEIDLNNSLIKPLRIQNSNDYYCNECDEGFSQTEELKRHREIAHCKSKEQLKQTVCSICGKLVKTLRHHMRRTHSEVKPFLCSICGKSFKQNYSLKIHLRQHSGERPFLCEFCPRAFSQKGTLFSHVKSRHEKVKGKIQYRYCENLGCPICGKKVKCFRDHMRRTHKEEKPHTCSICGKGFKRTYSLKVHVRQHTGERPFACELCPKAFSQKTTLISHIKSRHKESDQNIAYQCSKKS